MGDYPSIANFLEAQYRTQGSSNDSGYSNKAFDGKLNEAARQSTPKKAAKVYDQAQAMLMRDLPQIPLWYGTASTVWNPKIKNFETGWDGQPIYTEMVKED